MREPLLSDVALFAEGLAVKWLRLLVTALSTNSSRQALEGAQGVRVILAKDVAQFAEGLAVKRLRLLVAALLVDSDRQVVVRGRDPRDFTVACRNRLRRAAAD